MFHFDSDYNNGAHQDVLQHLIDTNNQKSTSYGFDQWSDSARKKIRECIECPKADVEFLVGGTQTNSTVLDSILATGDGVIGVQTAHIAVHESGAVENSGHKVITIPGSDGKMKADDLKNYLQRFYADETYPHMVQPGAVYITFPTELGTLYSKNELEAVYNVCQEYKLPLFIDGARMGYGMMARECDMDVKWLARHCDVFYFGGTKVGALCGEAVVFPKGNPPRNFFTSIKRHGALLAKGRLVGVQFDALFTDNLYFRISKHAIDMAHTMRQVFEEAGFQMYNDSPTNQQFVVIPNKFLEPLKQTIVYEYWEPVDADNMLCRFVTSWATRVQDVDALIASL
jgi:threonine aldolase